MAHEFPQLRQLAYERLDQDWDLVHRNPDDHVRDVLRYGGVAAAEALLSELETVHDEALSEEDAESWWGQGLLSGFNPATVEMTYNQWFEHMASVLRAALQTPPATS